MILSLGISSPFAALTPGEWTGLKILRAHFKPELLSSFSLSVPLRGERLIRSFLSIPEFLRPMGHSLSFVNLSEMEKNQFIPFFPSRVPHYSCSDAPKG